MDDQEIILLFIEESVELLAQWEKTVLELESNPTQDGLHKIFRVAHNLKGASKSLGFVELGDFVHLVEDLINPLRENLSMLTPKHIDCFFQVHKVLTHWYEVIFDPSLKVEELDSTRIMIKWIIETDKTSGSEVIGSSKETFEFSENLILANLALIYNITNEKLNMSMTYHFKIISNEIDTAGIQFLISLKKTLPECSFEFLNEKVAETIELLGVKSCLATKN